MVLVVAGAVLVALAILIAVSPPVLIYDERYYMESSYTLAAHFDLLGPLRTPLDLAAGPLYAYVHALLASLTKLQLPAVRYVNWAALAGAIRFEVATRVIAAAPAALQVPADLALRAGMTAIAALFLIAAAVNIWDRRDDSRFVLFTLLTVLANGTAAGIGHQFSSRYVLTAFPFALIMLQPWVRPGRWAAARLGLGALLGFASLAAYYWNAPPTDPAFKLAASPEIIAQMPLGDVEKGIR